MRILHPRHRLVGPRLSLRLVTLEDCNSTYLGWLSDPDIHQYLETRWQPQSLESIRAFVHGMLESPDSYLLAILDPLQRHIGNLKLGPINPHHTFGDVSYFIGDRSQWGKGFATEAIQIACWLGFELAKLHRIQAGLYEGNVGSARALEKVGFLAEGRFSRQLKGPDGWEDHLWYGLLAEDWQPPFGVELRDTHASVSAP